MLVAAGSTTNQPSLGHCKGMGVGLTISSDYTSTSYKKEGAYKNCNHYNGEWSCQRIVMSYQGAAKNIKVDVQPEDATVEDVTLAHYNGMRRVGVGVDTASRSAAAPSYLPPISAPSPHIRPVLGRA